MQIRSISYHLFHIICLGCVINNAYSPPMIALSFCCLRPTPSKSRSTAVAAVRPPGEPWGSTGRSLPITTRKLTREASCGPPRQPRRGQWEHSANTNHIPGLPVGFALSAEWADGGLPLLTPGLEPLGDAFHMKDMATLEPPPRPRLLHIIEAYGTSGSSPKPPWLLIRRDGFRRRA